MEQVDNAVAPGAQEPRDDARELMRATPAGRWLGAAVAALLALSVAGFALLILPWLQSPATQLPAPVTLDRVRIGFALLALIVVLLAAALAASGWRIMRSLQSPPPGALLWRDTRIVRGARARRTGIAYCAIGVLCSALGIGLGVTIWRMLERAAEPMTIKLPPGVTILKQTSSEVP